MDKPAPVKAALKHDQPENSVAMRVVCGLMALLAVGMACAYTHCAPIPVFIYLWLTMAGCYISYHQRNSRNLLNTLLTVIGLIVVLGMFAAEMWTQFNTIRLEVLIPFIHVLTGLLALHTFDLRTRADLNTNCLIGVGLLACSLVLGRDLTAGIIIFCYACLGATLFYLDSSSRTRSYGRFTPSEPSSPSRLAMHRESAGAALLPISAIPMLGLFFFLCLPRVNSIFDMLAERIAHPFATVSMAPAPSAPNPGPGGTGGSGNGNGNGNGTGTSTGHGVMDTGAHSTVMDTNAPNQASKVGVPSAMPPEKGGAKTGKGGGKAAEKGGSAPGGKSAEDQGPAEELMMRDKQAANYDDQLLFEVNAPGDFYYRRLVFDTYDGKTWAKAKEGTLSKCRKLSGGLYQELAGVPSLFLPTDFRTTAVIQEITVRKPLGHVIFGVTLPQKIDFPIDPVIVDDNGVMRTQGLLKPGMTYRVYSMVPSYNLDTMRKAVDDPAAQARALKDYPNCLTVPAIVPEEVKELAKNVAGTDGNWFVKSERICKFLRANYTYSSEGDDAPPNADQDLVDFFLFGAKKGGACGPFASAFAIMCREVGIPARLIGGFAPGDYNGVSGLREVHGKHGHAWAEVFIPKYGWVPFDATPSGVLPTPPEEDNSFMGSLSRSIGALEAAFNPPHPATPTTTAAAPGSGTSTTNTAKPGVSNPIPLPAVKNNSSGTVAKNGQLPAAKEATDKKDSAQNKSILDYFKKPETPRWWLLLLEGIMILGIIPMTLLLAQAIRAAYLQFKAKTVVDKTAKPSTVLYLRVVDDLKRFKISRSPSDTAHDISERFLTAVDGGMPVHPELPGLLKLFLQKYTDDRFGAPEESELRRQELQEIGDKIHTLVRTRVS